MPPSMQLTIKDPVLQRKQRPAQTASHFIHFNRKGMERPFSSTRRRFRNENEKVEYESMPLDRLAKNERNAPAYIDTKRKTPPNAGEEGVGMPANKQNTTNNTKATRRNG